MPPQWLKERNAKRKKSSKPPPVPFVPDWITEYNTLRYFQVGPLEKLLKSNAFQLGVYRHRAHTRGPYAMIPPGLFIGLTETQSGGNTFKADPAKLSAVQEVISAKKRLKDIPVLVVTPVSWKKNNWTATSDEVIAMLTDPGTKIHDHEGRHRAQVLRSLGVSTMPVHVMFKRSFIDMCASGAVI
jgi:hypothetical protein